MISQQLFSTTVFGAKFRLDEARKAGRTMTQSFVLISTDGRVQD
jgi:hypothetical protein